MKGVRFVIVLMAVLFNSVSLAAPDCSNITKRLHEATVKLHAADAELERATTVAQQRKALEKRLEAFLELRDITLEEDACLKRVRLVEEGDVTACEAARATFDAAVGMIRAHSVEEALPENVRRFLEQARQAVTEDCNSDELLRLERNALKKT